MNKPPTLIRIISVYIEPDATLWTQAPLPAFLDTLPILVTIPGPGSVLAGCTPLAPPEEPANDK